MAIMTINIHIPESGTISKPVISKLKDQLGLYMEHSKNAEQFAEILEMLVSKADALLAANDVELLVQNL